MLAEARTPAYLTVCRRGGGTAAHKRVSSDSGSRSTGKAAEPYESLLVTVGSGSPGALTITNDNPDTGPFFAFVVTGNLWLDDTIFSYHGTLSPDSTTCTAVPVPAACAYPRPSLVNGTTFSRLTGIMGWSFSQRRLYPRGTTTTATGLCVTGTTCPDYVTP